MREGGEGDGEVGGRENKKGKEGVGWRGLFNGEKDLKVKSYK